MSNFPPMFILISLGCCCCTHTHTHPKSHFGITKINVGTIVGNTSDDLDPWAQSYGYIYRVLLRRGPTPQLRNILGLTPKSARLYLLFYSTDSNAKKTVSSTRLQIRRLISHIISKIIWFLEKTTRVIN